MIGTRSWTEMPVLFCTCTLPLSLALCVNIVKVTFHIVTSSSTQSIPGWLWVLDASTHGKSEYLPHYRCWLYCYCCNKGISGPRVHCREDWPKTGCLQLRSSAAFKKIQAKCTSVFHGYVHQGLPGDLHWSSNILRRKRKWPIGGYLAFCFSHSILHVLPQIIYCSSEGLQHACRSEGGKTTGWCVVLSHQSGYWKELQQMLFNGRGI